MSQMPKRRQFSESEYLLVERQAQQKSEYFRGQIYAMAGASEQHEIIAGNCCGLLWQVLAKRGCGVFKSDMKVRAASGRFTYPDVVAVCGGRTFADETRDILLNPIVIMEVLSPTTADYDRSDKGQDYRSIGSLQDLVIVSQEEPYIEHFVRQDQDRWQLSSIRGLDGSLELKSVGVNLEASDIYRGIEFAPPSRPPLRVADEDLAE
jgi:Uma2 family endonuclease